MIFSLLKLRKKIAAALAGIAIAALCLWGLSMWQGMSMPDLLRILLGILIMLAVIMLAAIALIVILKLLLRGIRKLADKQPDD